jgi:hypothetical protein
MKNTLALAAGLAAAITMSLAYAQSGGGYGRGMDMGTGPGMGMGPGCNGADIAATCPGRYGPGAARGHGPGGGYGMMLLTPEERRAFHTAMHSVTTVEACNALVAQRQELIAARAKELALVAPAAPPSSMCERMKAHGMID